MFITRLISGIVLVLLALITMYSGGFILLTTLLVLSVSAFLELTRCAGVRVDKMNLLEKAGTLCVLVYYGFLILNTFFRFEDAPYWTVAFVVLPFFADMFIYVFSFPKYRSEQVMTAFFCFLYGPVCLSFIYFTRDYNYGIYGVGLILLSSWGCDTCAYCVGKLFGKHKMSPVLSPKKSVEGAVGGVIGAAVLSALFGLYAANRLGEVGRAGCSLVVVFAITGAVGALISMVGDLSASAIKRNHDVKDYGKLIPGHGGVMDRFDSVIFTAPIIFVLLRLIL